MRGHGGGLENLKSTNRDVGRERLVAPRVGLLEQRQLCNGVRPFPAHDDPASRPALGQQRLGQQGPVMSATSAFSRTSRSAVSPGDHTPALGMAAIAVGTVSVTGPDRIFHAATGGPRRRHPTGQLSHPRAGRGSRPLDPLPPHRGRFGPTLSLRMVLLESVRD